jgi:CBS-domain-containing membrane protein
MSWTVADVMTKEPVSIGPVTSFKACANLMRIHEVSALPVVLSDDRLVGIVSESDLVVKEARRTPRTRRDDARKANALTAAGLMTADVITTTASAPLAAAASLMFQHRIKVLPVVDSKRHLVGTVNRAQVLKVFLRSDESIRREVAREVADMSLVGGMNIEVEVTDGVVELNGLEETRNDFDRLSRVVMRVPGVVGFTIHPGPMTETDGESLRVDKPADQAGMLV